MADTDEGGPRSGPRWAWRENQALTVGFVTAAATVVAALITVGGVLISQQGDGSPSPAPSPTGPSPILAITSWSEDPVRPHGKRLMFSGTLTGTSATSFRIHVVAQLESIPSQVPEPPPVSGRARPTAKVVYQERWLVSPAADLRPDGSWRIKDWLVADPPQSARWVAVLQQPPQPDARTETLESSGPFAHGVVATAPARPH